MKEEHDIWDPWESEFVHELASDDRKRFAVKTTLGWQLYMEFGSTRAGNPFSCIRVHGANLPDISEASARAYVEHGTMPPELYACPRELPGLIERVTYRDQALAAIVDGLRARGVDVEIHDSPLCLVLGVPIEALPTLHVRIQARELVATWSLDEADAKPTTVERIVNTLAVLAKPCNLADVVRTFKDYRPPKSKAGA